MKKLILKIVAGILLISLGSLLFLLFFPRTYNVPSLEKRASTQFWNLSTGSKIAFTLIPAKGIKKPYPIIFLQGGPGGPIFNSTIEMLRPLAEDGYDVYLYDQIGCGFSDRLDDIKEYSVDRHRRDLEEIVKKIGVEKVILIAQSWGAVLATFFIANNSDKVATLILTSPGSIFPERQELLDIPIPDSLRFKMPMYTMEQADEKTNNIRNKAITVFALLFGKKIASDKEMDDFATFYSSEMNKCTVCDTSNASKVNKAGIGGYTMLMTLNSLYNVEDPRNKLNNSKIPILLLKGQCDYIDWNYSAEYLELFPNHILTFIPNAGHSIYKEQPILYLKSIRDFLNQQ